jgi:hypothetical protein
MFSTIWFCRDYGHAKYSNNVVLTQSRMSSKIPSCDHESPWLTIRPSASRR